MTTPDNDGCAVPLLVMLSAAQHRCGRNATLLAVCSTALRPRTALLSTGTL